MKKVLLVTVITTVIGSATFILFSRHSEKSAFVLTLANIEALTRIEIINGQTLIIDEIPCSSSAQEIRLDCSYVNCETCKSEKGQSKGDNGKCTNVREL